MQLRPQLEPTSLDAAKIERLTWLADNLDGEQRPAQIEAWLGEFNALAATALTWPDFQEIYGYQNHDEWVKSLLLRQRVRALPDISRAELCEIVRRIMANPGGESETDFYLALLQANVPYRGVSDLIFWPNLYIGDNDVSRAPTPDQIVEIALNNPGNAAAAIAL